MYSSYQSLLLGASSKDVSTDFPRQDLIVRGQVSFIKLTSALRSGNKVSLRLRRILSSPNSKILVLLPKAERELLEELRSIKLEFRDRFFYLSHKWIGGIMTNERVVNLNVERFFNRQDLSYSQSRLRTCKKMYEGLLRLKRGFDVVLALGGSEVDVAIKECMVAGVPVFATRNVNDRGCGLPKSNSLLINYKSTSFKKALLRQLRTMLSLRI